MIEFVGFRHSPTGVETPSGEDESVESWAILREEQVLGRALARLVGKTSQVDLSIATIIIEGLRTIVV